MYTASVPIFLTKYINTPTTQKRQIDDFKTVNKYVSVHYIKPTIFNFCVACKSMGFRMKFYTHVVYIHIGYF